jgi:hypothetical protein
MAEILIPAAQEGQGEAPRPAQPDSDRADRILSILEGYRQEAEQARMSGDNPRDGKWREILDLYWNRIDHSGKAAWQAKEALGEVSTHVDRFAAALKEAWTSATASEAYTVVDPVDPDNDMSPTIKAMLDAWLSTCGRSQGGHVLGFESVLEEQAKLGALMNCASVVSWREDKSGGRVAIESVDPRQLWLDHTYRNLYRLRRVELDRHDVLALAKEKDKKGNPTWNREAILELCENLSRDEQNEREKLTGHGHEVMSKRKPVKLDEWLATIPLEGGEVIRDAYCVVADGKKLIRGPLPNPFWHGRDWIITAPLITVPLSVYGRAYAEDFGSIAQTFNHLTNMILDAVAVTGLKAYVTVPEMLSNPEQLATGISPGKMFAVDPLQAGLSDPKLFLQAIDLGTLSSDSVTVWQAMKNELKEKAGQNEIGLGQFAPNSRTSATEVSSAENNSSALVRSIAQTFEQRVIEPMIDLTWKTGIQHVRKNDRRLSQAAGLKMFGALMANRKELVSHPLTFQARGISTLIAKGNKLRSLLQILQVIASNPVLLQHFFQVADPLKLNQLLFDLSNVDMRRVMLSERDMALQQIKQAFAQQGAGTAAAPSAPDVAGEAAAAMGVAR